MNDQLKPHVDVRDKVLAQCLRQLDALGCTYHIFCPWTGDEHGYPLAPVAQPAPVIVPPAPEEPAGFVPVLPAGPKKRVVNREAGQERNKHILPYLLQIRVGGDPVEIPAGPFTMDEIQGAVGARLARAFGDSGNYVTSRNNEKGVLQVLVTSNKLNPKLGEPEAVVKTFSGGPLAAFAETCLEEHRAEVMRGKLQHLQQVVHGKHKTA